MGMEKADTQKGISAPDAYHRIDRVITMPNPKGEATYAEVRVCTYFNKAARDADVENVLGKRLFKITPDISGSSTNTLADAYAKVKASSEHGAYFSGGVTDIDPD